MHVNISADFISPNSTRISFVMLQGNIHTYTPPTHTPHTYTHTHTYLPTYINTYKVLIKCCYKKDISAEKKNQRNNKL